MSPEKLFGFSPDFIGCIVIDSDNVNGFKAVEILSDSSVSGEDVRTEVSGVAKNQGTGIVEAPRETLIHDYTVDENGFLTNCNLIVATCRNTYGMGTAELRMLQGRL